MGNDSGLGISEIAKGQKDPDEKMWNCPLCTDVKMKFNTSCHIWPECGQTLNVNGKLYMNKRLKIDEE